jgi:cytochrome c-type biogenesis protein CcmH
VRGYLVQRYGQFVLLKPSADAANLPLWLAPLVVVALGAGGLLALWRRRRPEEALDAEEAARVAELSKRQTP